MPVIRATKETVDRIIAGVRKVEQAPTSRAGERNPPAPLDISFWAWLSSPGGSAGLFWSWVKVRPVAKLPTAIDPFTMEDPPLFELDEPHVAGYLNAREVSNNRNIPPESIVLMHFIGYSTDGEPHYVFQFHSPPLDPTGLPIHDHRDNLAGGFAFAVFHPGTSLPQQDFHP